jgi:integrase/recombinase XerD
MNIKISLHRFLHRGQSRIAIRFDYDKEIIALLKNSLNVSWSNTNSCWYADDNEENLRKILSLFRDKAEVDISAISIRSDMLREVRTKVPDDEEVEVPGKIKDNQKKPPVPVDDCLVPAPGKILAAGGRQRYAPVEFRIHEKDGRLAIRFTGRYDQEWIDELKSFGRVYFNKFRKEFLLRWTSLAVDSLSDYFSGRGVEVIVRRSDENSEQKKLRREAGEEIRARELGEKSKEALVIMEKNLGDVRYSDRTNETYLALLDLFFKYYHTRNPDEITPEEISQFIHEFVVANGYSASYQNQMISAIKYYYGISGTDMTGLQIFERPRRSRALPKVFSKEEVKRILNASRNNKHKLLLWLIYSCGLRRSEITNIRLTDLDRDRGILHIREGKGRVDRIVPVSDKVWEKLDEYIGGYTPVEYLFEGQSGGRYSSESVYRVFKQALGRAGIKKEVGVHSLRHSYATHLHESGLDIRYIQELLGHKSTRTTEIYTHVSRRNLIAVRSPIEDMDVK